MTDQLSLFGTDAPVSSHARAPGPPVGAAAQDGAIEALGCALPPLVFLGTSSWSFPGWAGIVYDRRAPEGVLSRRGLEAYGRHPVLRSVGIDRTFYASMPASEFAAYAAQVPDRFRFVAKAPSLVTDPVRRLEGGMAAGPNERFLDAHAATDLFVGPTSEGLGAKCGPLVFQISPVGRHLTREPRRFAERLHAFLAALPRGPLYAVELRDPELLVPDLAAALGAADARFCFGVHSRMPAIDRQAELLADLAPGPFVARWNLHAGLRYEEAKAQYAPFDRLVDEDPETRAGLAALVADAIGAGHSAFVIANNKAEGSAPLTIVKLAQAVVASLDRSDGR